MSIDNIEASGEVSDHTGVYVQGFVSVNLRGVGCMKGFGLQKVV